MNNTSITIDDGNVIRALRQFAPREMVSANRRALAASSMVLVKAARLKLRGVTARSASTRTADRKGWTKMKGNRRVTTLENGIRFKVNEFGTVTRINIMGDFRLKWFEMGAGWKAPRVTRKGQDRGDMPARPFFAPAINAAKGKMAEAMRKTIVDAVNKRCKA